MKKSWTRIVPIMINYKYFYFDINIIIKYYELKFIRSIQLSLVCIEVIASINVKSFFFDNISNFPLETNIKTVSSIDGALNQPQFTKSNKTWSLASERQRGAHIFLLFARCEGISYSHTSLLPSASATVRWRITMLNSLLSSSINPVPIFASVTLFIPIFQNSQLRRLPKL